MREAAVWCMLVAVLTLRLTRLSAGVWGALGLEEPLILKPLTLYNWMQCGALWCGGLDGTGRKMDEVSSTFTSAALLRADFVLIQGISYSSPAAPTRCNAELSHFYSKPNIDDNIQWHTSIQPICVKFIGCLCKLTETEMKYFKHSVIKGQCILLWYKNTYFDLPQQLANYLVIAKPSHVKGCFGTN